jgi:hypothetical protein
VIIRFRAADGCQRLPSTEITLGDKDVPPDVGDVVMARYFDVDSEAFKEWPARVVDRFWEVSFEGKWGIVGGSLTMVVVLDHRRRKGRGKGRGKR